MKYGVPVALWFVLSVLSAGGAAASTIECAMAQHSGNNGWVPPVIALTHAEGAATAVVSDQFILAVHGQPLEAKVATDNAVRTTYSWLVDTRDNDGQNAKMLFRLTVMKADLSARIKVVPQGYANDFGAGGTCRPLAG